MDGRGTRLQNSQQFGKQAAYAAKFILRVFGKRRDQNSVRHTAVGRCKAARDSVVAVGEATGEALPVKQIALVAVGVAVVVGVASLLVPHTMAAVVGAVGAAATAIAVQTGSWLKRAARRFNLVT